MFVCLCWFVCFIDCFWFICQYLNNTAYKKCIVSNVHWLHGVCGFFYVFCNSYTLIVTATTTIEYLWFSWDICSVYISNYCMALEICLNITKLVTEWQPVLCAAVGGCSGRSDNTSMTRVDMNEIQQQMEQHRWSPKNQRLNTEQLQTDDDVRERVRILVLAI